MSTIEARWNGQTIARSSQTVVVEGNHYFPLEDVDASFLKSSATTSFCGWKGTANYYDVIVGDDVNSDAAWYYAEPKPDAEQIRGRVAFWKGVEIVS